MNIPLYLHPEKPETLPDVVYGLSRYFKDNNRNYSGIQQKPLYMERVHQLPIFRPNTVPVNLGHNPLQKTTTLYNPQEIERILLYKQ